PVASAADRAMMCRLAFADCPWAVIDEREIHRDGTSWSVETARELAKEFPEALRVWVLGADQLARLDRWKDVGELCSLVEFAVLSRDGISTVPPSGHRGAHPSDRVEGAGGAGVFDRTARGPAPR
ncbi:MAG: nicotinate (nicotinamide) nucleotide adenylyltransferase, partial [Verrucomicrobiota bacterium]